MTQEKPHFKVIAGRPVSINKPASKVDIARQRFGGPFAHEVGTHWKGPHETPVLTAWLATNPNKKDTHGN